MQRRQRPRPRCGLGRRVSVKAGGGHRVGEVDCAVRLRSVDVDALGRSTDRNEVLRAFSSITTRARSA